MVIRMSDKRHIPPYSCDGSLTNSKSKHKELKMLERENQHLQEQIAWFVKSHNHYSSRLKFLEDKMEKVKNDTTYKVNTEVLKRCLIVRKYRRASHEVKNAFTLLAMINGMKAESSGSTSGNQSDEQGQDEMKDEMGDEDVKTDIVIDHDDWMPNDRSGSRYDSMNGDALGGSCKGTKKKWSSNLPGSNTRGRPKKSTSGASSTNNNTANDIKDEKGTNVDNVRFENNKETSNKRSGKTCSFLKTEGEFICDQCGKVFTGAKARGRLTSHVRYHNTPRLMVECEICGKKVKGKYKLVQHIKDHSRQKKYECNICHKSFLYKYNLSRHMLLHSGEKPYSCQICNRTFRQKNQAEQHMDRIHIQKKTQRGTIRNIIFQCLDCDASYTYFNCLVYHLKNVHVTSDLKNIEGEGETILFNSIAQRHVLHYMKDLPLIKGFGNFSIEKQLTFFEHPNQVDLCCSGDKKFQKHVGFKRRKNYLCTICGQVYAHQGALKVHMRIHTNERPFQCQVCFKRFRQRTHLATHTRFHMGIKRYKCSLCGKGYSGKPDLVKHLEKIHNSGKPQQLSSTKLAGVTSTTMSAVNINSQSHPQPPVQRQALQDQQLLQQQPQDHLQQQQQLLPQHQELQPLQQQQTQSYQQPHQHQPQNQIHQNEQQQLLPSHQSLQQSQQHPHAHQHQQQLPHTLQQQQQHLSVTSLGHIPLVSSSVMSSSTTPSLDHHTPLQVTVLNRATMHGERIPQHHHHHHPQPHHQQHNDDNQIPNTTTVTIVNLQCIDNATIQDDHNITSTATTTNITSTNTPPQPPPSSSLHLQSQPATKPNEIFPIADLLSEDYSDPVMAQSYHTQDNDTGPHPI